MNEYYAWLDGNCGSFINIIFLVLGQIFLLSLYGANCFCNLTFGNICHHKCYKLFSFPSVIFWREKMRKLMMEEFLMCRGPKTWPKWRKAYKNLCIFTILPSCFVEGKTHFQPLFATDRLVYCCLLTPSFVRPNVATSTGNTLKVDPVCLCVFCLNDAFPEEGKWVSHHYGFCLTSLALMVTHLSSSILGIERTFLHPIPDQS